MATLDIESIIEIEAPPQAVWRTMIDTELAWRWLGAFGFVATVSHLFLIQPSRKRRETRDLEGSVRCQVEVVEPNRRLRFSWTYGDRPRTEVTFVLTPITGGTHVRVTHAGWDAFEDLVEPDAIETALLALGEAWANEVLPELKLLVEG